MKLVTFILTFFCAISAWSQSTTVIKGEYIFVSSVEKEHQRLKNDLKKFKTFSNTTLNKTSTLWRFKKDPGLKQLQSVIKRQHYSGTIQPNFVYKLIEPVNPEHDGRFPLKKFNLKP